MKLLYVCPEGCGLVDAFLEAAERIGYREMTLDTLASTAGAQVLYRKFGFEVWSSTTILR
jgi:ribosomal protein S18 acetylase RimI-like enzyme